MAALAAPAKPARGGPGARGITRLDHAARGAMPYRGRKDDAAS